MEKDTNNKKGLDCDELEKVSGGCLRHGEEPPICNKPGFHPVMPMYGIPQPEKKVWTDKPKDFPKEIEEPYDDVLAPLKNSNRNGESK